MYNDIEYFKDMIKKNKTVEEVARINNVSKRTILEWEKKHDLKLNRNIPIYQNRQYLEDMIKENKTVEEVARINNVSKRTILNWEKKHNLKLIRKGKSDNRKYFFDENFFEDIDCEEKAYFLGFIMADGYIGKNKRTVNIALKVEDAYILQKLLDCIGSTAPLGNKKNDKQKVLIISSVKMVRDLEKYSIKPNKTYTLDFPKLREDMYRHYIRGYFDGDGYIGARQCTLVISSCIFLQKFLEFIKERFNIQLYNKPMGNSYRVNFNRRDKTIVKYLYEDTTIFLNRKKEKCNKYWSD